MKKGFTLIELLAVIVILAVIALIATPIILNIIEDTKEQSVKSSANLYVDGLTKQIASRNMTSAFNPSSCTISNGNVTCDGQALEYNVNGDKPTSGSITLNNGIVTGYILNISGYTVTKSGNNVTIAKELPPTYEVYTTGDLVQYDPVNNSGCETGDTCYKWRVITVGDTISNATITLQMDHNLVNKTPWVSRADYNDNTNYGTNGNNNKGPITALKALETATASWDDSLKLNYTYDTSSATQNYGVLSCTNGTCIIGENTITTNLKARMITGEELRKIVMAAGAAVGSKADNWLISNYSFYSFADKKKIIGTYTDVPKGQTGSTELVWLVENTATNNNEYNEATSNAYGDNNTGYWSLSQRGDSLENAKYAWYLTNNGGFGSIIGVNSTGNFGVRPVITIPKSVLE